MSNNINTNTRLFDLVRYMRSELHEAGLITDEEYAWLSGGSGMAQGQGSPSPRRLEDYDEVIARVKALEADKGWRPIETAPKDEDVLIAAAHIPESVGRASCENGEWYKWPYLSQPTHWMPLPEPPKEDG